MNSITSTETPVREAARLWGEGQASLFEFAVIASAIVGRRDGQTEQLAKKINRHPSTVERYAKGGLLWLAMLEKYPSQAEILREVLEVSYWNDIGRLYAADVIDLNGAKHWLEEASVNRWTVEKTREMLPNKQVDHSTIKAKAIRAANFLENEIVKAPALDIDKAIYSRVIRVVKLAVIWLRKLSEQPNGS